MNDYDTFISAPSERLLRAFVALSPSEKLSYQCVKAAVLKAYELIPEHYRQTFRTWKKTEKQTHVDVARELISLCNRWCTAVGVKTFQELFDLVVLEQFKNIVPEVWPESPPPPVVNVTPSSSLEFDECAQEFPSVFTSCALTHAKA
uniref:SCAN box domain-containing protein n=1 Tax=Takifugu rubripes TaxID=31033 RepID=A0A674PKP9_TAKRU